MSQFAVSRYVNDCIDWRVFMLMTCVLAGLSSFAKADDPSAAGLGNAAANEVAEFKGKLKGVQQGVLQVTREDGVDVLVQFPKQAPSLTFVAEAKPGFLQRGMLVRFSGSFAPNGAATGPIDKVEIFQPVNLQGVPGHSRDRFMPGVHPADKHGGKKKPVGIAKYTIVGSLMGINGNGAIMVQAGKVPVVAPLAQAATFEIRFHNLNLAQEGDAITVAGFYEPPDDTKIRGDKITISTDRIYGLPPEPPPRRARRVSKRTQANPKAGETENTEATENAEATGETSGNPGEGDGDLGKPE